MSAATLSVTTIRSGAYQASGYFVPSGGSAAERWTGTVSASAAPWSVAVGSVAQAIVADGGGVLFGNPTLSVLGVPNEAAGMALRGPPGGSGTAPIVGTLTYTFTTPLAGGQSFVLWAADLGGASGSSFAVTALDGNSVVQTGGWDFAVQTPGAGTAGAVVSVGGGVVNVAAADATGSGATLPEAAVVITTNAPISEIAVTAQTTDANLWGLALPAAPPAAVVTAPGNTACFLAGTAIMTPCGPVAVERLAPGDRVLARFAGEAPVVWIGRRRVAIAGHADPAQIWPVRIRRDAVAPGVPCRDLLLSPDHAVCLGGVLIPVKYLLNGDSIRQDRSFAQMHYLHVELARHDVLLAEALPVESYLDTGNRADFDNHRADPPPPRDWARDACALLWGEGGPAETVRAALARRSHSGKARVLRRANGRS